jgi:hypothetical protein
MTEHVPGAGEGFVERRRGPRLRSLLIGAVVFDDRRMMDCQVRNISAYGARIMMPDAFRLPDEFELRVPHHDQTHHAQVVWRKGDTAGVALSDVKEMPHREHQRLTPHERDVARRKELDRPLF